MIRINNIMINSFLCVVILIIITLGIYYYFNNSKRELEKQIRAFEGMFIDLNIENGIAVFDGKDSLFQISRKNKLVVYVDRNSCSSCFLNHLGSYEDLNDNFKSHGIELIIILYPFMGRIDEMITQLKYEPFPFWCIVDVKGEFIANNSGIPENPLLHTFTLNEHNNIIFVGDPIRNNKIKDLFFREVLK